jgi:hypothetical protein
MFGGLAYAQVGIGTNIPNHALEIESTDSGLVIPRVANTAAVTVAPVAGTMVFDLSSGCIKSYDGTAWSQCFGAGGSTPSIRVTSSGVISDADLNGIVIYNDPFGSATFDLSLLSPSEGDTITIVDAGGSILISGANSQTRTNPINGNAGTITYIFTNSQSSPSDNGWWNINGF